MKPSETGTDILVWIVEDDAEYRQTLQLLLEHTPGLSCGDVFESCEDALDLLEAHARGAHSWRRPDVLLLDVNLPGLSGLDGIGQLKALLPGTGIVMLTIRDDAETIYDAFRGGASGYLLKNAGVDQIIRAVREARDGGTLMPAPVARKVLAFFQQQGTTPDYGLTDREKDVLREMTEGRAQKEIADRLYVSPSTINTHIQHIYEKLHVHSGIEAVAKALRERLV